MYSNICTWIRISVKVLLKFSWGGSPSR